MRLLIALLSFLYCVPMSGQENDNLIRLKVLECNVVDSIFVFGKWTKEKGEETHLKYLGKVKTINGSTYKIMTSIWIWGLSRHATSRILVYNAENQYLGNYYVYGTDDLPVKLEEKILIFKNRNKDECDKNITPKIDLSKGIPKEIFLRCEGENGDVYNFTSD